MLNTTTQLFAARRYLTNVLLVLSIDSENMTVYQLIQLLEYFAENPTEYLELTNGTQNQ
jgi:phage-related protein|tara:strand:- start:3420 stop:3596 length:177 start_codon:yes stop_codon:yes gene_type:complete